MPQDAGGRIFLYTLVIGGGAMSLSAVLSLTGVPFALMFDAIVSMAIGLALASSGVLIYRETSSQALVNIAFGVIFAYSGYRNWREFSLIAAVDVYDTSGESPDEDSDSPRNARHPGAAEESGEGSFASFSRKPDERG